MARRETRVADHLAENGIIVAICGGRIFDVDYRTSGWNTAPVEVIDAEGFIQPTIVVDDTGDTKPLGGPKGAGESRIEVWVFATRFTEGLDSLGALIYQIEESLDGWQDPETREMYHYIDRQGKQFVEDGVIDRVFFRIGGMRIRS